MSKKSPKKPAFIPTAALISAIAIIQPLAIADAFASSDADYNFRMTSDWQDCQQIGTEYNAVYAFETASFYINICQKDSAYFYLGEAKQSDKSDRKASLHSSIFLPAYPLENGSGFQAQNGNVSYLVLLPFGQHDSNSTPRQKEAILTIKRNDRLVAVESSLNKYCHQPETKVAWDTIELQPHDSQLATIPQQQDAGLEFSTNEQGDRLPSQTFNSDSRFDFYRIGGELHRLATCD